MNQFLTVDSKLLICTVGLPRSGKSTWANLVPLPVVNPDTIRLNLHGKAFDPERETEVWKIVEDSIEKYFKGSNIVILDATNITDKRRNIWSSKYECLFYYFPTPLEVCLERATPELIPVINRMYEQLELPKEYIEVTFDPTIESYLYKKYIIN